MDSKGYCIYSYDVTPFVDTGQRASLSADVSAAVIETCIKLRGSDNIRQTFDEVIEDIRKICDSDHCCILLTDMEKRRCTTLCEGTCMAGAGDDIRKAMRIADERMYDNKKEYYEIHPEQKYR